METCTHCHRADLLISFRPAEIEKETKRRQEFDTVAQSIAEEGATRQSHPELFCRLDACRTKTCMRCKNIERKGRMNPTTLAGQCRELWYELRNAPCVDCGRADGYSEYDHQEDRGGKIHNLGDFMWWKWNGGVEVMTAEATKCVPRCRNCHQMQPSNNKYKRKFGTLDEMPTDTLDQVRAKHGRRYIDEKIAFVDECKMQIGACAECEFEVTSDSCHVFAFAHIDAGTKKMSVSAICMTRQCLKRAKPALVEEMAKCRLLCAVCHSKETRMRNTI